MVQNKLIMFNSHFNKTIANFLLVILFISLLSFTKNNFAQSKQSLRYEIDAKRGGMSYTSKDALPRGREFKRLDSTYYVGWMFEGTYKFEHAADYLGFKMAADQLNKALKLLEKDFKKEIYTRTSDVFEYLKVMKYQRDWDYIVYNLTQCYSNTEEADKLWALLQKCRKVNSQLEVYADTYNYLAWTVHRNRFYTSSKYPFLRNSIDENEHYANKLLDSGILKIKNDAAINKTLFTANYENEKIPGVWHYKSILFSYQLNIESGAYYYEKLRQTVYFPKNNFATFCMIQGKFREAEKYYNQAKEDESGDKRMKEPYYYSSIVNAYKNANNIGIEELKSLIKANGSTPGFGWYNIALARNLLYNGQIDIAKRYAKRAEQFKEIHVGTTLGQSHYDFTISLINLIVKNREIETVKYLNKNWWYSPTDLKRLAQLTIEKYGMQFLIINQFANNPERDRVVYKLFSTESTVSFDEVWQLLDGFSVNFFLDKYISEISNDKRFQIKRYYQLFVGKLLFKKNNYKEALTYLNSAYHEMQVDEEYEKLFKARCLETIIQCKLAINKKQNVHKELAILFELYPQLIPFSTLVPKLHLQIKGSSPIQAELNKNLLGLNIDWVENSSVDIPTIDLVFTKSGATYNIQTKSVLNGKTIIPMTQFTYKNMSDIWPKLAFSIFGVTDADESTEINKGLKKN